MSTQHEDAIREALDHLNCDPCHKEEGRERCATHGYQRLPCSIGEARRVLMEALDNVDDEPELCLEPARSTSFERPFPKVDEPEPTRTVKGCIIVCDHLGGWPVDTAGGTWCAAKCSTRATLKAGG